MKLKPLGHIALNWVLPLAILIGAAVAVKMLGTQQKTGRKKAPPQVSIPVDVVKAELHQGPLTISASGVVVPFREVDLPTEIGGRIIWKSDSLLPGKYVNQGDELLKIDSADYQLEVDRLEQQVTKANSDLARATIDIENARRLIVLAEETLELRKREVSRMKMLRQNRASSNAEYDAAEKSYVEAKQSLTVQENSLRSLEADRESLKSAKELAQIGLSRAKLDLARTVIRAPFSGVVINQRVEADSHVQVGNTIARIEDTSKVEVRCSLRKEDLDFLPELSGKFAPDDAYSLPNLPVTIRYSRAGRNYSWAGVLSRQDGLGMDEKTRTMPVRILIDDPLDCRCDSEDSAKSIALVRGMFVQVELHCTPDRALMCVPEEAIRPGKMVWKMTDEQLVMAPVHIVRIENGIAYIDGRDGELSRQDTIIRSPVPGAKDGLAVTANAKPRGGRGSKGGRGQKQAGGDDQSNRQVAVGNTTVNDSGSSEISESSGGTKTTQTKSTQTIADPASRPEGIGGRRRGGRASAGKRAGEGRTKAVANGENSDSASGSRLP